MIAFLLLVLSGFLYPEFPVFAALTLSAAFYAAKYWGADVGETLELFVFYGAITGCLVGWFA